MTFCAQLASGGGDEKDGTHQVLRLTPGQPERQVLVVDDDAENREMLAAMLGAVGFVVATAEDGPQALRLLQHTDGIDLVLIDRRMPEMDGVETIGEMRSWVGGRRPAILMVTAADSAEDRAEALAAGADGFLSKPLRRGELLEEIGRLLAMRYEYGLLLATREISFELSGADRADLAALPPAQRALLAEALRRGDVRSLRGLLTEISAKHATLAARMGLLVNAYAYDRLRELLDETAGA